MPVSPAAYIRRTNSVSPFPTTNLLQTPMPSFTLSGVIWLKVVKSGKLCGGKQRPEASRGGATPLDRPSAHRRQGALETAGRVPRIPQKAQCRPGLHHHGGSGASSNLPHFGVEVERKFLRECGRAGGISRRRGLYREIFWRRLRDRRAGARADAGRAAPQAGTRIAAGLAGLLQRSDQRGGQEHARGALPPRHGESERESEDAREEGAEVAVMYARPGHVARGHGIPGGTAGGRLSGRDRRDGRTYRGRRAAADYRLGSSVRSRCGEPGS